MLLHDAACRACGARLLTAAACNHSRFFCRSSSRLSLLLFLVQEKKIKEY
jgi:hypothetical protein